MERNIKYCNACKCVLTSDNKQIKYKSCKTCYSTKRKDENALYRLLNEEKIKEQYKVYRESNKEKIKERSKLYLENNKERIREQANARMREKITCSCGQILSRSSLKKHQTTFHHL